MKKVHQLAITAVVLALVGSVWFPVTGQQRPREDVLDALLVEVRGLRGAIEHMASASARVQRITSRLQLQEQRLNTLLARLAGQRDRLVAAERDVAAAQRRIVEWQEAGPREADALVRQNIESRIAEEKHRLANTLPEVERLRGEETELANVVAAEQARWSTINKQLEELEAVLRR
jgi:hypothetical protein